MDLAVMAEGFETLESMVRCCSRAIASTSGVGHLRQGQGICHARCYPQARLSAVSAGTA